MRAPVLLGGAGDPRPPEQASIVNIPRLRGPSLALVRALASTGVGARCILSRMGRAYGLHELRSLPSEARADVDLEPRPIRGGPPRRWTDANLGAPATARSVGAELRRAYASGALSPVEILDGLAARVQAADFGRALHSPFVCTDWETARAAARESEARHRAGQPLSPLDGLPLPIKDEHDMAGLVTGGGTAYRKTPAECDSTLVRCLREGGALLFAKTHATEWGMNPWGMNPHHDMPRNVYDSGHGAGGSSTGAGVAVGLGLAAVAAGSDGGGSIRIPSSFNGVFGLKPTFGRVGRGGSAFGRGSVSHIGPLGPSTADLVDFLCHTTGVLDPVDPPTNYASDGDEAPTAWRGALGRGVRGCRIGVPLAEFEVATESIQRACRAALAALEAEGATLVDLDLPLADQALAVGVLTIAVECMGALSDDLVRFGEQMGDDLRLTLRLMGQLSARDYLGGCRTRAALRRCVARAIAGVDVLALPTTAIQPPAYSPGDDGVALADAGAVGGACRLAFLANLTGLPAGSVPVAMSDGLPIGLQIVGDAWDEASVLAVMAHLERIEVSAIPAPESWKKLTG
ncbi:MAG TPA: amidase [Planctomycetota bacterium]|jgi:aspartyl-tRNA(Asn)/glutamyl-tRNA(Gln) amidotransferase subunit A|nr:amidase [Planctomycetota bacterium]